MYVPLQDCDSFGNTIVFANYYKKVVKVLTVFESHLNLIENHQEFSYD